MKQFPRKLHKKLSERKTTNSLRKLVVQNNLIDFSSNDYLGFSASKNIFDNTNNYLITQNIIQNGATGSRLISGNHQLYTIVENMLCEFHQSEAALIFNSGYDANVGFFSSVPQRGDIILYDDLAHASIRAGIRLSNAKAYSFKHNDLEDLEQKILRQFRYLSEQNDSLSHTERRSLSDSDIYRNEVSRRDIYIVTESIFSMDGDSPDLIGITQLCNKHNAHLIVDEAHAVGVLGNSGCGEIQRLGLENDIFARLITFGKGLGCHGAAILGRVELKEYLVNFARSFIYTTALPPHSLATIVFAYEELKETDAIEKLNQNIQFFKSEIRELELQNYFIESNSAIHCCIISGNEKVKNIANQLQKSGFNIKPILSPTVHKGQERLRFCLHSYNSTEDIDEVLKLLSTFVSQMSC